MIRIKKKLIRGIAQVLLLTLFCTFVFIGIGTFLSACEIATPVPRLEEPTPPVKITLQEATQAFIDVTETPVSDQDEQPTKSLQTATLYPLEQVTGWPQHAHDAQRTGYTHESIPTPWRWKWSWNGPTPQGDIAPGKTGLPRNVQPIIGGGRVYIARGNYGVYALDQETGEELWSINPEGNFNTSPAYDHALEALYVTTDDGRVFQLNASDGEVIDRVDLKGAINNPPALVNDRLFISAGAAVYALNRLNLEPIWDYRADAEVDTAPSYSRLQNRVIVGTRDLYVHAIDNQTGNGVWRVKPTVRQEGDRDVELRWGWPVIAEEHELVLIKYRLEWEALWTWDPWPITNEEIRSNLEARPGQQALFALNLADGSASFISNIGHGGWGDGDYLPMGPQPVVKKFEDGSEVVYIIGRGGGSNDIYDGRWDSVFVEMMLDDQTVPDFQAGEIRFIQYNHIVLTDEQPFLIMAGDYLLAGHWMAGLALQVTDRSPGLGYWDFNSRIQAVDAPHITTSQELGVGCANNSAHYCAGGLLQDNDNRPYPPGFYLYFNQGTIYDGYWSGYSTWVAGEDLLVFRSTDGAIVAFEHGDPFSQNQQTQDVYRVGYLVWDGEISNPGSDDRQSPGPQVITIDQTRDHIGETSKVKGKIKLVFNNKKSVYLGFADPHQGSFKVIIPIEVWDEFSTHPELLFNPGQEILITGKIVWYQGDPVIYLRNPRQIE